MGLWALQIVQMASWMTLGAWCQRLGGSSAFKSDL